MPSMSSESGSAIGNEPRPMRVWVTGIWVRSASSRSSGEASEEIAPPPT